MKTSPEPKDFRTRPSVAAEDRDLRTWLRHAPMSERMTFLLELLEINPSYAIVLAAASQLDQKGQDRFLGVALKGSNRHARQIIEVFEPVLGEKRFWSRVVANVQPGSPDWELLDYYGRGKLSDLGG